MPKTPIVKGLKLIKVLEKKGFSLHRITGSHHVLIRNKDQLTVVVPAHKGHDLGRGITLAILKDAQITVEEFLELL